MARECSSNCAPTRVNLSETPEVSHAITAVDGGMRILESMARITDDSRAWKLMESNDGIPM